MSEIPEGAHAGYRGADGEFVPLEKPDFDSYSDDPEYDEAVVSRSDRLTITPAGRDFVLQELVATKTDIMISLGDRVADLFEREFYDTCIREACVQLEHEIRDRTGTDAYGGQARRIVR